MRNSSLCSIDVLLNMAIDKKNIPLFNIQQKVATILKLNKIVNELLPVSLRPWCRVANVRDDIMILETASASWQMWLIYEQFNLLSKLKEQDVPWLLTIEIKINPDLAKTQQLSTQIHSKGFQYSSNSSRIVSKKLSVKSAQFISQLALRSEGKLKAALNRLAQSAFSPERPCY